MADEPEKPLFETTSLRNQLGVFSDRTEAGDILAKLMADFAGSGDLVLGIPAGGVTVAVELARKLGLDMDVAVVNKVTPPWNSEWGFGAVAFDGSVVLNEDILPALGLDEADLDKCIERAREKVRRRVELLQSGKLLGELADREIILVDDGLATGITMRGAVEALARAGAKRIIAAVPTAHGESVDKLLAGGQVEAVYCPNLRTRYEYAVAQAYLNWHDMSDQEIVTELAEFRRFQSQS